LRVGSHDGEGSTRIQGIRGRFAACDCGGWRNKPSAARTMIRGLPRGGARREWDLSVLSPVLVVLRGWRADNRCCALMARDIV
jgi:hypothetical protein